MLPIVSLDIIEEKKKPWYICFGSPKCSVNGAMILGHSGIRINEHPHDGLCSHVFVSLKGRLYVEIDILVAYIPKTDAEDEAPTCDFCLHV